MVLLKNGLGNEIFTMKEKTLSKNFSYLGEGIARKVYAIDKDLVLKVAKGRDGLYQNAVEHYIYTHAGYDLQKYLCPILYFTSSRLVMPRACPINKTHNKTLDLRALFPDTKSYDDILILQRNFFILYEDLIAPSSWGILNGKKVLVDYGCTSTLGFKYYMNLLFSNKL